ncbi:hypothetical protein OUZ56_027504 [Daphnia magna]|uniref:Protein kinase domain-containing protein n=1 Tax=Daphnia magna TaxID=35525 RepID=A0ABQ9ZPY8_9CRUS|nr:hypothetical protein OUZ56_027504 [Daphnia magna]
MAETPKRKKKQISIDINRVELGVGSYGHVLKGKYKGRPVAVKRVLLDNYSQNEEEAMLKLDHPNIIKLLHCESDNNFRYYAMELCVASLDKLFLQSDHPQKYNGPMPRHIEVFHQLASGIEHIHSKNLIHRDIKPENILISMQTAGQNEEITIKWADFGLSRTVNERGTFTMKSGIKGTKKWFAPEILRLLETDEEGRGDVRSDVFALALVFGCLFLDGQHLYGSALNKDELDKLNKNIIEGKPVNMQKIDEKLRGLYEDELLQKMLEDDPSKRMTSKQVVDQLKSIKEELARKEEELRQLCAGDIQLELTEKIKDLIRLGIDVNAKDKDGNIALDYLYENRSRNPNQQVADAIKILEAETVTRSTKRKGEEPHADENEHKKRG